MGKKKAGKADGALDAQPLPEVQPAATQHAGKEDSSKKRAKAAIDDIFATKKKPKNAQEKAAGADGEAAGPSQPAGEAAQDPASAEIAEQVKHAREQRKVGAARRGEGEGEREVKHGVRCGRVHAAGANACPSRGVVRGAPASSCSGLG